MNSVALFLYYEWSSVAPLKINNIFDIEDKTNIILIRTINNIIYEIMCENFIKSLRIKKYILEILTVDIKNKNPYRYTFYILVYKYLFI